MNPLYLRAQHTESKKHPTESIRKQPKRIIKPYKESEIAISQKIQEIPFFFHYFSPIQKWQHINGTRNHILVQEDYEFTSFADFFANTDEKYRKNRKLGDYFLVSVILSSYSHLLKALDLLNKSGIIYGDVRKIGLNRQNQPILFDFEKSWRVFNTPLELEEEATDILPYLPIEAHLLHFLQTTQNMSLSLDNISLVCEKYSSIVPFSKSPDVYLFTPLINKPMEILIQELTRTSDRWDLFGLSILYLQIVHIFSQEPREKTALAVLNNFTQGVKKNMEF